MNCDFLEKLGLDGRLVELIFAESERELGIVAAERDRFAAELAEVGERCVKLEDELQALKSESTFSAAQKAFDVAVAAIRAEHERELARLNAEHEAELLAAEEDAQKMLAAEKAEHEKALSAMEELAQKRLEEALAAREAELEKEKHRERIQQLFSNAGFSSTLALQAAVNRFIAEGRSPESAGEWLTNLRATEPDAFAKVSPPGNLPRFTVEPPPAEDGEVPGGGFLSSMLKKLR